jgi:hypothetical protein
MEERSSGVEKEKIRSRRKCGQGKGEKTKDKIRKEKKREGSM